MLGGGSGFGHKPILMNIFGRKEPAIASINTASPNRAYQSRQNPLEPSILWIVGVMPTFLIISYKTGRLVPFRVRTTIEL